MSPMLKLDKDDEEKERDFDLRFRLSCTPDQRIRMMLDVSKLSFTLAKQYATRKTYRIIQRS